MGVFASHFHNFTVIYFGNLENQYWGAVILRQIATGSCIDAAPSVEKQVKNVRPQDLKSFKDKNASEGKSIFLTRFCFRCGTFGIFGGAIKFLIRSKWPTLFSVNAMGKLCANWKCSTTPHRIRHQGGGGCLNQMRGCLPFATKRGSSPFPT